MRSGREGGEWEGRGRVGGKVRVGGKGESERESVESGREGGEWKGKRGEWREGEGY